MSETNNEESTEGGDAESSAAESSASSQAESTGGEQADAAAAEGPSSSAEGEASAEPPEAELARLKDRLLRTAADYDNYRKRTRRDIADAERRVQEQLLMALLPTFDNLERASAHAASAPDVKALAEGLNMVLRQFRDALAGIGIERIAAEGKPFDPAEHEAVQHMETNDAPPGAVVQELQAGYRWQGKLLRPALVVVSKAAPQSAAQPNGK